jgi:hypothetical protein
MHSVIYDYYVSDINKFINRAIPVLVEHNIWRKGLEEGRDSILKRVG